MPRFNSASLSIAAAVPFISAVTAAPFVSDATAALFVSTITTTVSNRLGSSVLLKSTVSYAVRLSGDSRKAMSSGFSAPRIPCHCSSVLRVPWCCGSYFWCVRSVTQGSVLTMITADIISSRLSSVKHTVSTRPEEATEITFGFLVGES
ncbi:unnamed protein product, partial [Brassica oleracea var. botrytis]